MWLSFVLISVVSAPGTLASSSNAAWRVHRIRLSGLCGQRRGSSQHPSSSRGAQPPEIRRLADAHRAMHTTPCSGPMICCRCSRFHTPGVAKLSTRSAPHSSITCRVHNSAKHVQLVKVHAEWQYTCLHIPDPEKTLLTLREVGTCVATGGHRCCDTDDSWLAVERSPAVQSGTHRHCRCDCCRFRRCCCCCRCRCPQAAAPATAAARLLRECLQPWQAAPQRLLRGGLPPPPGRLLHSLRRVRQRHRRRRRRGCLESPQRLPWLHQCAARCRLVALQGSALQSRQQPPAPDRTCRTAPAT